MKQFTIYENPTDRAQNWSSFHNADLPKLYETEFQGPSTVDLPTQAAESTSITATTHPFKVDHVGGNIYRVQAGTVEGQFIATQTIDVGSTRPVAILAYPKYTLSIFNSEYVWAATVMTGTDAPVLTSSTTTLSDVTLVTSAGTEARVLIAQIDSSGISQITTGNIVGTFASDGSLTGQMNGSFNKNS